MGQLYMQRFEFRGAISKPEYDAGWAVANEVMAKTGNWGNVKSGVKHLRGFLTAWGATARSRLRTRKRSPSTSNSTSRTTATWRRSDSIP